MDTYFFDKPGKAIMKACFLLVTYIGSILFKNFTVTLVLPTVLIYFLSNATDYAELAFFKSDKVKKIKYWSLAIFLIMIFVAILTFCMLTTDNSQIINYVEKYYGVFYFICIMVWAIPLIDGIRGQCDEIRKSSEDISEQMQSSRAFDVTKKTIVEKATDND